MLKAGIACGCLSTQKDITTNDLYHHLLKQKLLRYNIDFETTSYWYDTTTQCRERLRLLIKNKNPDVLLYHVRPSPYLRMSKIFIRYHDTNNRLRFKINLTADDGGIKERVHQPITIEQQNKKKYLFYVFLREFNFFISFLAGINQQSIKKQMQLLKEVVETCERHHVNLILIGPPSRPRSIMENYLLARFEKTLSGSGIYNNFQYISCYGSKDESGNALFQEDGMHVSKIGHKRLADLIFPAISKSLDKK